MPGANSFADYIQALYSALMLTIAFWGLLQLGPVLVAASDLQWITVRDAVVARSYSHWAWLAGGVVAFYRCRSIRNTRDRNLHQLDWEQFEVLVADVYRRNGYRVEARQKKGADGGIDFHAVKRGKHYIVQCKRWSNRVGVPVVREMAGVLAAQSRVAGVIIVTNNSFTSEAIAFASNKAIELVNGDQLQRMMR